MPLNPANSRHAPAPISDGFLRCLRDATYDLRRGDTLSATEAEALLHHMPGLLDELVERRAAMARPTTVVAFAAPALVDGGDAA
ncbi:hypothetical protein [Oceaniglobus trochenteri]|uniref:hypothetical protein n=1 Tax=Oceaniglobus trochenteri TaxID=2763260 RepID=UPI001CFFE637|nr:hypothetical protein [Oceaniglobus trochenteri]